MPEENPSWGWSNAMKDDAPQKYAPIQSWIPEGRRKALQASAVLQAARDLRYSYEGDDSRFDAPPPLPEAIEALIARVKEYDGS